MNLLKKGNLTQNCISISARNKNLDFPAPCTEAAIGNCFYRHRHFLRHTQTLTQAIGNCFNRHFLSCFIRSGGSSAPACHSRHFTSYYTLYFTLYSAFSCSSALITRVTSISAASGQTGGRNGRMNHHQLLKCPRTHTLIMWW